MIKKKEEGGGGGGGQTKAKGQLHQQRCSIDKEAAETSRLAN